MLRSCDRGVRSRKPNVAILVLNYQFGMFDILRIISTDWQLDRQAARVRGRARGFGRLWPASEYVRELKRAWSAGRPRLSPRPTETSCTRASGVRLATRPPAPRRARPA